jgi:hypothetical protein
VTDTIKAFFGVPPDPSWGTIVSQNIPFFLILIAAVVVLIALVRRYIETELPPADWSVSFNADAHGTDVTPAEANAAAQASARQVFDAELFEKIALVSLVTVIFSRILPGAETTVLQTAIGVGIIILANTVISEWLRRQGVVWQSVLVEFVAMAITNAAIFVVFFILLPLQGGQLDTTLFFLLLLTLLVTLYDRFRPYYQVRQYKAQARTAERAATAGAPPPAA